MSVLQALAVRTSYEHYSELDTMLKTMASMATCIVLSILFVGACTARAHPSRLTETVLDVPVYNAGWNAGLTKPLYMSGYFKVPYHH